MLGRREKNVLRRRGKGDPPSLFIIQPWELFVPYFLAGCYFPRPLALPGTDQNKRVGPLLYTIVWVGFVINLSTVLY